MNIKTCPKCGTEKQLTEFARRPSGTPQSWCMECTKKQARDGRRKKYSEDSEYRKKEQARSRNILRQKREDPAHKEKERISSANWREKARPEIIRAQRQRARAKMFSITVEQLEALDNMPCKICGVENGSDGRRHAIDHDHRCCPESGRSCGKCIRGVLCWKHNKEIGYFEHVLKEYGSQVVYDYIDSRIF